MTKKHWFEVFTVYFIMTVVPLFFPYAEGYESVAWRLLVGQIYAVSAALLCLALQWYIVKKRTDKS